MLHAKQLFSSLEHILARIVKMGTSNYYVNLKLMELLANVNVPENAKSGT